MNVKPLSAYQAAAVVLSANRVMNGALNPPAVNSPGKNMTKKDILSTSSSMDEIWRKNNAIAMYTLQARIIKAAAEGDTAKEALIKQIVENLS